MSQQIATSIKIYTVQYNFKLKTVIEEIFREVYYYKTESGVWSWLFSNCGFGSQIALARTYANGNLLNSFYGVAGHNISKYTKAFRYTEWCHSHGKYPLLPSSKKKIETNKLS